jgi:ribosome-associated protein
MTLPIPLPILISTPVQLKMNNKIQIPQNELEFKASRSSGPGGQNINKLNTKIAIALDVPNCTFLSEEQKRIILKKLAGRITKDNRLIIESQKFRTQKANRDFAVEKLKSLIEKALKKPKKRKPTRPTAASVEKRLKQKRLKSITKQQRRKTISAE